MSPFPEQPFNMQLKRFGLTGNEILYALVGDGRLIPSPDSRVTNIGDLMVKASELIQQSEAVLGMTVFQTVTSLSGLPSVQLPPQVLLSPEEFQAYAAKFMGEGKTFVNPSEDVYAVTDQLGENAIAYGSRSSICPPLANVRAIEEALSRAKGNPVVVGGVQPCLRQEVEAESGRIRYPWFTQTDTELVSARLGYEPIEVKGNQAKMDAYSTYLLVQALIAGGVPIDAIKIRVGGYMNTIVPLLESQNLTLQQIEYFGYQVLNALAAKRAGGALQNSNITEAKQKLGNLGGNTMDGKIFTFLSTLISENRYDLTLLKDALSERSIEQTVFDQFVEAYKEMIDIKQVLNRILGRDIVIVDPCQYRGGYPGYDGNITMQADVILPNRTTRTEIAGGGSYPGVFQTAARVLGVEGLETSYAVGWAIGNARFADAVNQYSGCDVQNNLGFPLSWKDFCESTK